MSTGNEYRELASRIATSIKELGFFIGQQDLDDVQKVISVLNAANVAAYIVLKHLDKQRKFYALDINDKACRTKCLYESSCPRDNQECIQKCIEECIVSLRRKIAEVLEDYASRGG